MSQGKPLSQIREMCHEVSVFLGNREEYLTVRSVSDIFRNDAGIYMHWGRIRCIDPETKFNGMKETELQLKVFEEFVKDLARMKSRAECIYKKYSEK